MKIFSIFFLICTSFSFPSLAEAITFSEGLAQAKTFSERWAEAKSFSERLERIERLVTEQRWACSIKCRIFSADKKSRWATVMAKSGSNVAAVFNATLVACDDFLVDVREFTGEELEGGVSYDDDGNASLGRNCIKDTLSVEED